MGRELQDAMATVNCLTAVRALLSPAANGVALWSNPHCLLSANFVVSAFAVVQGDLQEF